MSGGCMVDCEIAFNRAKYDAGGVFLSGASRMIRCQVYTNYSETSGGGVRAYYFNGFVQDCGISNNYSKVSGGGISGGVISNCVIAGNTASGNGGGLYMTEAAGYSMIATSCIISNNHAGGIGGGGYVQTAGAQVIDCAIVGNRANNQSGGFHCNGTMNALFRNCLIASNSSSNPNTACGLTAGGGARVESCTIVGNQKDFGLKILDTSYVTNTIIASNSVNYVADISGLANNFFYSCCPSKELPASQGNINVAPGLVDVANGDFHLAPDSPCLNKGVNQTWMNEALDLGGGYRLDKRYLKVDMGCFERQLDFNGRTVLVIR